jgi:hypothetical protein
MATKFNEIFAIWDLRQVVEWRANLCFKVISVLVIRELFFYQMFGITDVVLSLMSSV